MKNVRNIVFEPGSVIVKGVLLDSVLYEVQRPDGTWTKVSSPGIYHDEWAARRSAYRHAAMLSAGMMEATV